MLKIRSSKPPTARHILTLIDKEASELNRIVMRMAQKIRGSRDLRDLRGTVLLKSAVPATTHGKTLAEIRNNIGRARVCLSLFKRVKFFAT